MKTCPQCGTPNPDQAAFCANPSCFHHFSLSAVRSKEVGGAAGPAETASRPSCEFIPGNRTPSAPSAPAEKSPVTDGIDALGHYLGGGKAADLNWTALFSNVFTRHTVDEAEAIFTVGTSRTTPAAGGAGSAWPRPWLYSRVFLSFAATYFLLRICADVFGNSNALPGLLVVGAFAVPVATMVLFFELNVWRNISLYRVLQLFGVGGAASIVSALFLFRVFRFDLGAWQATIAAFVEEPAKAVIVWHAMRHCLRNPSRILNGMLLGAAVGAGFAAFESAGYAFNSLVGGSLQSAYGSIALRALWAPAGHVAWAAIQGAAFAIVARGRPLGAGAFFHPKFLGIAFIPVVLHFLWNSPWCDRFFPPSLRVLLLVLAWIVVLFLVNRGLSEAGRTVSGDPGEEA